MKVILIFNLLSALLLSIERLNRRKFVFHFSLTVSVISLFAIFIFGSSETFWGDSGFFHSNLESVNEIGKPLFPPAIYQSGVLSSLLLWKSIELGGAPLVPPFIGTMFLISLSVLHQKLSNLDFATSIRDSALVLLSASSLFTFTRGYLEIYPLSSAITGILIYVAFASSQPNLSERNRRKLNTLIGFLSCLSIFSHLANAPFVAVSLFLAIKNRGSRKDLAFLSLGIGISAVLVILLIDLSNYPLIEANIRGGGDGKFLSGFDQVLKDLKWALFILFVISLLPLISLIMAKVFQVKFPRPTLAVLVGLIAIFSTFELLYGFDLGYLDLDLRLLPALGLTSASLYLLSAMRTSNRIVGRKVLLLLTLSAIVNLAFQIEIANLSF